MIRLLGKTLNFTADFRDPIADDRFLLLYLLISFEDILNISSQEVVFKNNNCLFFLLVVEFLIN